LLLFCKIGQWRQSVPDPRRTVKDLILLQHISQKGFCYP